MSGHVRTAQGPQKHLRRQRVKVTCSLFTVYIKVYISLPPTSLPFRRFVQFASLRYIHFSVLPMFCKNEQWCNTDSWRIIFQLVHVATHSFNMTINQSSEIVNYNIKYR